MNKNYFNTLFLGLPKGEKLPVTFAILTACNPMDRPLSKDENKKRNLEMLQVLSDRGKAFIRITGSSPDRAHQEPSFLVHCSRQEGLELGLTFEQRAIFWVRGDQLEIIECSTEKAHAAGSFMNRIR